MGVRPVAPIASKRYLGFRFQGFLQGPSQYLAYKAVNGAGKVGCEYIFDFFIHCLVLISFSCITTTSRLSQYVVSNPVCFTVLNIHSILDQITSSPVDHIESLAGLSNWHTRKIARFWGRWYVNEIRRLFPSEDYGWWYLDRHCWVMCRTNKYPRNVNVCMGTLPIVNFHLQWWNDPDGQCLKAMWWLSNSRTHQYNVAFVACISPNCFQERISGQIQKVALVRQLYIISWSRYMFRKSRPFRDMLNNKVTCYDKRYCKVTL